MTRSADLNSTRFTTALSICALGAAAMLGSTGCQPENTAEPVTPNIIIYLVDTLRHDHLGIYGYSRDPAPRLTEFANDAVRFDRAFSTSSWTRPAVASLLSGIYPAQHGARTRLDKIAPGVRLVGEYLHAAGYYNAAFVSNVNVLPLWGFDRGFDRFIDVGSKNPDTHSEVVTEAVFQVLDEGAQAPFLYYIHTRDPHRPYRPPPPYDELWPEQPPSDATNRPDGPKPNKFAETIRNYDGEVSYNDAQFGKLIDRLKAEGLYRDSLIVFTADHGEEFSERGLWGHGESLFGEVVRIPLLIKLPGNRRAGKVVAARTTLVDLLPTLLSAVGVEVPDTLAGIDLLSAIEHGSDPKLDERPIFFDLDLVGALGHRTLSGAVIQGPFKYTERSKPTKAVGLWNLDNDPLEISNLADQSPKASLALSRKLAAYRDSDHSGVHFWVQGGRSQKTRAKGWLQTSGRFERLRSPGLEDDDRVVLGRKRRRIDFDLVLADDSASPDRDGIVFDVFPPDATVALRQFVVAGEPAAVRLGRDASNAGELPVAIDRESPAIAIDRPSELFQRSSTAASEATGHIGFVSRSQGELSDLSDPIVERLKALGYVE